MSTQLRLNRNWDRLSLISLKHPVKKWTKLGIIYPYSYWMIWHLISYNKHTNLFDSIRRSDWGSLSQGSAQYMSYPSLSTLIRRQGVLGSRTPICLTNSTNCKTWHADFCRISKTVCQIRCYSLIWCIYPECSINMCKFVFVSGRNVST